MSRGSVAVMMLERRRPGVIPLVMALAAALLIATQAESSALEDTTPPFLVDLSIAPGAVDVSASSDSITFTAEMADDLSGVGDNSQIRFRSPSSGQFVDAVFPGAPVSGDALSGVWQAVVEVPQYAEAGTWTLEYFLLADQVGNLAFLTPSEVSGSGLPTTFFVTSPSDTLPPELIGFSIVPGAVDVSAGSDFITFTASLTDDLAGVARSPYSSSGTQARFRSPTSGQFVDAVFFENRISGSDVNGIWEATVEIPQYAEAGTWTLEYFLLVDQLGNMVYLTQGVMDGSGLPTEFSVTSPSDILPPELIGFSIAPDEVDVSAGSDFVTFTASLTDDLAGVARSPYSSSGTQARFMSPTSGQSVDAVFFDNRISGNDVNGVWQAVAEIPQFSEAGTWTLEYFLLVDQLGNMSWLYPGDPALAGLPTTFTVTGSQSDEVSVNNIGSPNGPATVTPVPATPGEPFLDGFVLLGERLSIDAPDATDPTDPIVIVFAIDPAAVPTGIGVEDVVVFRNGDPVGGPCTPVGVANPSPCIDSRDGSGDPWTIEVRTMAASEWALALADSDGDGTPDAIDARAEGFFAPVEMGGAWNVVKGGATVPLRFEVFEGDTEVTDPAVVSMFAVIPISCDDGAEGVDPIVFTSTGATSLRYDDASGAFVQNWKTPKLPGMCLRLTVTAADGATLSADFQLK